jgi:transcriptional regulator with XRE-family HTH domain
MALGDRIKVARRASGLTLRDVAEKTGVSAQAVSKYERGLDVPSSGVLLRLAPALGVTLDFLFRPSRVIRITPGFRKLPSLSRKQEDIIVGQVLDWLERYLTVEDLLGENRNFCWPAGFPWLVATADDAEQAALALREAWQLGHDPIQDMTELLEDQGIKVGILPTAPSGFDACSFPPEAAGGTPVIAVSGAFPGDRQRFNLVHELAHLALRMPEDVDAEQLANRFAGAFLVPGPVVISELGRSRHDLHPFELHLLKHKYGASMQCWIHRAEDLGILSQSAAERLRKIFRAKGWRHTEPGDQYPLETPTRMQRLVLRALAEDVISDRRAGELLASPFRDFLDQVAREHGGFSISLRDRRQHLD